MFIGGQGSGDAARAVLTGEVEDVSCGLVISSIGYKSLPIDPAVPFDSRRAVVPNSVGRVHQAAGFKTFSCNKNPLTRPFSLNSAFLFRLVLQRLAENGPHRCDSHHYEQQLRHGPVPAGGHGLWSVGRVGCQTRIASSQQSAGGARYSDASALIAAFVVNSLYLSSPRNGLQHRNITAIYF